MFGDTPVVRRLALCEVDEGLARQRADEFGFETATADWRALVADPAVDVVSITTPTDLHAPMAIAALEAGKHVWCEKPMAPALADAERMAAAARASGKVAILGYNYIQSSRDPLHPRTSRAGRDRKGHPVSRRDGRGFHGRLRRRRSPGAATRARV